MLAMWNFTAWWQSLSGVEIVFWCIAIGATLLQVLFYLISAFTGHDFDGLADAADTDFHMGGRVLSLRTVIAFLLGFGWTGGLFMARGHSPAFSVFAAFMAGFLVMGIVFLIVWGMMSLRADGTLDFKNAIGLHGQVYVTIPAAMGGRGQIEILVQGRLLTLQAITKHGTELTPQTTVVVNAVEAENLLVVSPVI